MQLHLRTINLLWLAFLTFPTVLASVAPKQCPRSEDVKSCQTATLTNIEIRAREAIRATAIYSSGATVGMMSACHLTTNHVQRSRLTPQAGCFALGLGTGIITAAAHTRLIYTEDAWRWVKERMAGDRTREGFLVMN